MACPKKQFHFSKMSAFLLAIFSATVYLSFLTRSEVTEVMRQIRLGEKAAFIETLMNTPMNGPLDTQPLRDLCASQTWTAGLIISCAPSEGGISDMRNAILNCVRYTIEAGGAFVVPSTISQPTLSDPEGAIDSHAKFSHLFDKAYFISSLAEGCPQMRLFTSTSALHHLSPSSKSIPLTPSKLSPTLAHSSLLANPFQWRASFDSWLKKKASNVGSNPLVVDLRAPVLHFPITYDAPSFTANFGKILRPGTEARALAASVLHNLSSQLSEPLNPSVPVTQNTFLGAYVTSTGADSAAHFESFLSAAVLRNLSTIYVASQSAATIEDLQAAAAALPDEITIVTKDDLLSSDEKRALVELSWHQAEAVDIEVLSRAGFFVGTAESSAAWNMALKRHALLVEEEEKESLRLMELGMGVQEEEEKSTWLDGPQSAEDGYSILFGKVGGGEGFVYGMWP